MQKRVLSLVNRIPKQPHSLPKLPFNWAGLGTHMTTSFRFLIVPIGCLHFSIGCLASLKNPIDSVRPKRGFLSYTTVIVKVLVIAIHLTNS